MAQWDKLKSLHTYLVNTLSGYDEAIKDADHGETRSLFEEARAVHASSHNEVHAALLSKGEKVDEAGSLMGTVQNTMIFVRSAVTGLGRSSLKPFITGERSLADAYDEAIEEARSDPKLTDTLVRQKSQVLSIIGNMESQAA